MPRIWAGVDIGKEHHHCVVLNDRGERLLSRQILNDEGALLELIRDVLDIDQDVLWATDINHGGAALLPLGARAAATALRSHRPARGP